MKLRSSGTEEKIVPSQPDYSGLSDPQPELPALNAVVATTLDERTLLPSVLVLESPDHYQAVVSFNSLRGVAYGWGCALETRYTNRWGRGGERGLVLEEVKEENLNALSLCLTRSWQRAVSRLDVSDQVPVNGNWNGSHQQRPAFLDPFLTLLRLDCAGTVSADFSPSFKIECQSKLQALADSGISQLEAA